MTDARIVQNAFLAAGETLSAARVSQLTAQVAAQPLSAARIAQAAVLAVAGPPQSRQARVSQVATMTAGTTMADARITQTALIVATKSGVSGQRRNRAWTYTLDGHSFYVLDLGAEGTFVFDLLTQQWSEFETTGYGNWDMVIGHDWVAGKMTVAGSQVDARIQAIAPGSFLDEGWRRVNYTVTGYVPLTDLRRVRNFAFRMVATSGRLSEDLDAQISLSYSDDGGAEYSSPTTRTLIPKKFQQRVEFRSLGAMQSPGRIYRITDEGGVQSVSAFEAEVEGEDGDSAA